MLHIENEKNAELIRRKRTPGEIVAAERKKRCWTQEELGWRCGISAVQIGKIERDAVRPKIETIKTLEDVLELPLLEVFMEYRHFSSKIICNTAAFYIYIVPVWKPQNIKESR